MATRKPKQKDDDDRDIVPVEVAKDKPDANKGVDHADEQGGNSAASDSTTPAPSHVDEVDDTSDVDPHSPAALQAEHYERATTDPYFADQQAIEVEDDDKVEDWREYQDSNKPEDPDSDVVGDQHPRDEDEVRTPARDNHS